MKKSFLQFLSIALSAALIFLILSYSAAFAEEEEFEAAATLPPVDYAHLRVANPTPLTGHFFTSMWGSSTSDIWMFRS